MLWRTNSPGQNPLGHIKAQNGATTSVGPVLFKIWSNYLNSLLASNYFSFSFLWADLLAKDTDRFWNIRFVVQTQSYYLFLSPFASWGKDTSFTFPCNANLHHHETTADLLHSASSNCARLFCHYSYSYWRWASSTSTTWLDYLIMSHCGHLLDFITSATSRHASIIIKTRLASTSCQRLQYRHNFPNLLLEILQAVFSSSLLRVPLSTNTMAICWMPDPAWSDWYLS